MFSRITIPTKTFTDLKSVTVKIPYTRENLLDLLVGHSDGRLGKQVTIVSRHTKTLVGKFRKITDPNSPEFEVGNGKD